MTSFETEGHSSGIFCPFRDAPCHCGCGLAVWVDGRVSTCALAVIAVRGTEHKINSVPIETEGVK